MINVHKLIQSIDCGYQIANKLLCWKLKKKIPRNYGKLGGKVRPNTPIMVENTRDEGIVLSKYYHTAIISNS